MSWRDKYLKASFRGVPFVVESHQLSGGRRGTQHEYVQRDKPFAEDTGRKGRSFSVEAFVVGTDYFAARDALITALETEGPGELIHPYLGRQFVQAFGFSVKESTKDGGIANFSITFNEAGESAFPNAEIDNRRVLGEKSEDLLDQIEAQFAKVFSVLDQPKFIVDEAVKKINSVADKINEVTSKVASTQQKVAETQKRIQDLKDKAVDLVHTPEKLAKQITDALRGVQTAIEKARDQFLAFGKMLGFGDDDAPIAPTTSTRVQQADNAKALDQLTQVAALAFSAQAASDIPYESTVDALAVKNSLVFNFEKQEENPATSDEVYAALVNTKAEVRKGVPPPSEQLPTIGKLELAQTTPSLVLVYDIYENPLYEQDLIDRNKVAHPGFIPGGKTLEILQVDE
jgi:prophage DNA circulation protein